MGQQGNTWTNDQAPAQMGGMLMCPVCASEITGPFSATLANNKVVRKWGCSRCAYVWKIEDGGFKSAFAANPVTFG